MHYVYVLRSDSDHGLYIGYSANLSRRLTDHEAKRAFSTSHRGPWTLIYYEAYIESADALGRERYLKSGGGRRFLRVQLRHYLKGNPIRSRVSQTAWDATSFYADDLHPCPEPAGARGEESAGLTEMTGRRPEDGGRKIGGAWKRGGG